jgi:hypothetical protein
MHQEERIPGQLLAQTDPLMDIQPLQNSISNLPVCSPATCLSKQQDMPSRDLPWEIEMASQWEQRCFWDSVRAPATCCSSAKTLHRAVALGPAQHSNRVPAVVGLLLGLTVGLCLSAMKTW